MKGNKGSRYGPYLGSKRNTKDTLFVGANDGMLHAFDADNGQELFAYIPNEVFPKLAKLSNPKYGCDAKECLPHEYLVDGKSVAADAYFKNQWHTVLVGSLGLGVKAVYALDVSRPSTFKKENVLWEISDSQSPDGSAVFINHMGLSIPEPSVVKMTMVVGLQLLQTATTANRKKLFYSLWILKQVSSLNRLAQASDQMHNPMVFRRQLLLTAMVII